MLEFTGERSQSFVNRMLPPGTRGRGFFELGLTDIMKRKLWLTSNTRGARRWP